MTHLLAHVAFIFPLLLLWVLRVEGIASDLTTKVGSGAVFEKEMMYTSNSLCRQNYCTNPIFPGINDLPRLEALQWQCSTTSSAREYMDFCKDAVIYDPALPSPQGKPAAVTDLVKAQEDAAMTMFVYHLSGMGFEAWDHRNPAQSDDDCVRSVWKMVCFTYFPRADAGCKTGEASLYKRPCKSCANNYLAHCSVECCDESVQSVFAHTSTNATGQVQLLQSGYVDQNGPSAACTGGAKRSLSSPILILLGIFGLHFVATSHHSHTVPKGEDVVKARQHTRGFGRCFVFCLLGLLAVLLQGCDIAIPHHKVGNWRTKPNYLNEFKYVPPGKGPDAGTLNSCNQPNVPATKQCSGRGYCKSFTTSSIAVQQMSSPPLSFCQCERDWADPECGTKRKSQRTAFFWSLFLGWTGADYFYLGYPLWGVGKLVTLGGLGFWWLLDIVRTGAGPVYAHNFRTANDLPHWIAVMLMVFLCMFLGFFAATQNYLLYRRKKRSDILLQNADEEARPWKNTEKELKNFEGPRRQMRSRVHNFEGRPGFSGYGAAMPLPLLNQNNIYASRMDPVVGPFGPAGIPGTGSITAPAIPGAVAPTHIVGLNADPQLMPWTDPTYLPQMNDNVVIEN